MYRLHCCSAKPETGVESKTGVEVEDGYQVSS